jgi:hypothetical protein
LTFALVKRRFSSSPFDRCESARSNQIIRMLGALEWHAVFTSSLKHS